ncbi:phospholipase D-like domain-containing protein [Granulosicoccus antarcticus]|uniref:Major cardiolipin synthase ClsA n=1 Tax=Granulosicoccus antarcticus IMCC3135 TaxID=1192854 RepID=A0A2Z2NZT9_9GAMM|nr:phospholipase D-like domain-containing protein [Granulosicoccus antarcticus]ASJ74420.1 Major cardiolipin synthase ClsA [Granulosicoccus antarcticus IMCC3135]
MNGDPLDYVDPGTAFSLAGLLYLLLALAAGVHVVLNKQNEGAAFSWLGIIVLAPLVGAILYWLFGINRIRRRAQAELPDYTVSVNAEVQGNTVDLNTVPDHWLPLMRLGGGIHHTNYMAGNSVEPLINGDAAYPVMIDAINQACQCVVLSSYIFEYDDVGSQFVDALVAAHERGVEVRVLIDGLGVGYGFSLVRADRVLRRRGVKTARFLSTWSTAGTRFINLRNHRKILSVDGQVAFVGGMNIRAGNLVSSAMEEVGRKSKHLTQDVHFKVQGPVINQINAVFAADWQFAARESLSLPHWHGEAAGSVSIRALLDGPDDNYQKLQLTILGAIQAAKTRICVVSPYFLPDRTVLSALQIAVLRGVRVDICVPARNNLLFVGWAMLANRRKLLRDGIHLHESDAPFDHSKLFLVDDYWSMIGSSNWDARSLELNFEINLECYDKQMNAEMSTIFERKLASASEVSDCADRYLLLRLRNNFFRLFSPYL